MICIEHNTQGSVAQFVLKYLVGRENLREMPSGILNNSEITTIMFEHKKFFNSLNYLHMGLSALLKAYGLGDSIKKWTFPTFIIIIQPATE